MQKDLVHIPCLAMIGLMTSHTMWWLRVPMTILSPMRDWQNVRESVSLVSIISMVIGLIGGGKFSITNLALNLLVPGLYIYGAV